LAKLDGYSAGAVWERSSKDWTGSPSDAADRAVSVLPGVLSTGELAARARLDVSVFGL